MADRLLPAVRPAHYRIKSSYTIDRQNEYDTWLQAEAAATLSDAVVTL
jgi:hypothetical protein